MSDQLVIGNATMQSIYTPWPDQWATWPNTHAYQYVISAPNRDDEYANEVDVEQNEHDATIHFYRSSGPGKGKTLIKTITVPLSILEWMQGNR